MRVATLLTEDLTLGQVRDMSVGPAFHGRLVMTKWVCEGLITHPDIEQFAVCGEGAGALPGARPLPFAEVYDWLSGNDAVWFEAARQYWWKPGLLRRMTGRTFPVVTMMHSVGYPSSVERIIACVATPRCPGDIVIAPSQLAARVFRQQCTDLINLLDLDASPPDMVVIPYGVRPVPEIPYEAARAALAWDARPTVLFVGRLKDKADFDALFEAAARLDASGVTFRLVLAGSGIEAWGEALRMRSRTFGLQKMVDVRVNVSEAEKHVLLSACDVFVSPANVDTESFGLTLIEAMLHGRPVVASAWDGYREIVRDGVDGLLVDTWWNSAGGEALDLPYATDKVPSLSANVAVDVAQLTHCLKQLIDSREMRTAYGQSGRQRASLLFSMDRVVADVVSALREAVRQCPYDRIGVARPLRLASVVSAYASRQWNSAAGMAVDDAASSERAARTGMLSTDSSRSVLEQVRMTGAFAGEETVAFELFQRGLLMVTGEEDARQSRQRSRE